MPRTKGAKNKPKSDEALLAELKARGYELVHAKKEPESEETPPEPTPEQTTTKQKFELKEPEFPEPESEQNPAENNDDKIVLRCGNPACGKILKSEVSTCPYCGAGLTW